MNSSTQGNQYDFQDIRKVTVQAHGLLIFVAKQLHNATGSFKMAAGTEHTAYDQVVMATLMHKLCVKLPWPTADTTSFVRSSEKVTTEKNKVRPSKESAKHKSKM
ncbi:hypothetical protein NDU88_012487 [Pleurodeles waltl]|uniref:Uncharacterized protein n=1 Tax=Pleurodeles waltl TaxID=8319 RepID=A0AAV7R3D9_PLEWA|nr:hypothetical protein NDU88_012487 [Pleurodeles waltl]